MVGFGKIMEMGQKLQERIKALQDELEKMEISASSKGGMVTATVNGQGSIRSVEIEKHLTEKGDQDLLENLVLEAISKAQDKANKISKKKMKKITGRLPIPLPGLGL
ncbi:MAG: YbaB/EbfC family nucleoid-associated protein [Gemmatimonadetes bacterium]|jgi:DNA-binding YbaB/EbfC family protein|nr:YbaB/EbfC family nucleoid-associated protein [Gemmatimonadota bacterium]MCH2452102.1 YbaB/EbfC family nucleoid-associated protein [Gemmatimonadota bacterium]|tara:strand:+ start:308 stop:628 length:321 start_codon:yes stop_codon:yes gene_type:complete